MTLIQSRVAEQIAKVATHYNLHHFEGTVGHAEPPILEAADMAIQIVRDKDRDLIAYHPVSLRTVVWDPVANHPLPVVCCLCGWVSMPHDTEPEAFAEWADHALPESEQ